MQIIQYEIISRTAGNEDSAPASVSDPMYPMQWAYEPTLALRQIDPAGAPQPVPAGVRMACLSQFD